MGSSPDRLGIEARERLASEHSLKPRLWAESESFCADENLPRIDPCRDELFHRGNSFKQHARARSDLRRFRILDVQPEPDEETSKRRAGVFTVELVDAD